MSFSPVHSRESGNPAPTGSPLARGRTEHVVTVSGTSLVADPAAALYWPEHGLLAVADLHLEKGSSFAARGQLLPPYDTAATLAKLTQLVVRYAPRLVVALGDNFHDGGGPSRMMDDDRAALSALQRGREWIWIAGNHDPEPADGVGGAFHERFTLGALTFRHLPGGGAGEICGHLHPSARIAHRGRSVRRRCFAADATRLVMPAFGAFTGGLNIRDAAFAPLFPNGVTSAHVLGRKAVYGVGQANCWPD